MSSFLDSAGQTTKEAIGYLKGFESQLEIGDLAKLERLIEEVYQRAAYLKLSVRRAREAQRVGLEAEDMLRRSP